MFVASPSVTLTPTILSPGGKAAITVSFCAASALHTDPAEIILMFDRSSGLTSAEFQAAKEAVIQFIDDISQTVFDRTSCSITGGSTIGLLTFADCACTCVSPSRDTERLKTAIDMITPKNYAPNFKAALEAAEKMRSGKNHLRSVLVLFTHREADACADCIIRHLKETGSIVYCIGLGTKAERLASWASSPAAQHAAFPACVCELPQAFRKIAAEIVLAGVLDGELFVKVSPDFKITSILPPSHGTVEQTGERTLSWSVDCAGLSCSGEIISLAFEVAHVGNSCGTVPVNRVVCYHDRRGNCLCFPNIQADISCCSTDLIADPCPLPQEFTVDSCTDAVHLELSPISISGLGRIVQLDAVIQNVCPHRQIAVSVILEEIDNSGCAHQRGVRHFLIPGHDGMDCRDVTLRCVRFSVPEVPGQYGTSICGTRKFHARVIANYTDTDFTCCEASSCCL